MILYEPVNIIENFGVQGKLFFKYIKVVQFKNYIEVVQLKSDEYMKEVQRRYKRRYSIKNIILKKIKDKIKFMEEYIKTVENTRDELERERMYMDNTIDNSLSILYKQIIKLYLISLGFEFDESINMKSLSYPKKFIAWKVDDFNFNKITDKIITTLQSVKKFVEDEKITPKDYKFNVKDVETLRDKDNYEASLFRTVIQFQQ